MKRAVQSELSKMDLEANTKTVQFLLTFYKHDMRTIFRDQNQKLMTGGQFKKAVEKILNALGDETKAWNIVVGKNYKISSTGMGVILIETQFRNLRAIVENAPVELHEIGLNLSTSR